MGFWAAAAPIIGSVLGGLAGNKTGKKTTASETKPWDKQAPYLEEGYGDIQNWKNQQLAQNLPWEAPFSTVPQRNIYEQAAIDQVIGSIPGMQNLIAQVTGVMQQGLQGGLSAPYSGAIGPGLSGILGGGGFNPMGSSGAQAVAQGGGLAQAMPQYTQPVQQPAPFTMREPEIVTPQMTFPLGANPMGNLAAGMSQASGVPVGDFRSQAIDYSKTMETKAEPAKSSEDEKTEMEKRFQRGIVAPEEFQKYQQWLWKTGQIQGGA